MTWTVGLADTAGVAARFRVDQVWQPELGGDASVIRGFAGRGFFNLIRDVSVQENVALPLYPLETGFAEIKDRVDQVLDRFGILSKKNLKVKKLSGGEQQRVAIARALINDPEIIIADEPTAHLDQELAKDLLGILEGLCQEGKTIIIATHDPLIFEHHFVNKTFAMRNGQIEGVSVR